MPSKIFIVDDDPDTLKLISLMLKRQGYDVSTAESGQDALDKVLDIDPDLIILDVMMPDMDGYTVSKQLRSHEQTVDVPILMFTAKNLVDDKVEGFEAGADDYLTKPTHPDELAARVKALLARKAAKQKQAQAPEADVPAQPSQPEPSSGMNGITIGFIGVKGGVGVSTLATNLGAIMAEEGYTALVDFRLGRGTIGASMGHTRSTGLANLMNRAVNEINNDTVQQEIIRHESGLNLLLSSMRSRETQTKMTPDKAGAVVSSLIDMHDFVLIDLGSGLNAVSISYARNVDHVVVCVEPTKVALAMGYDMLTELRQAGVSREKTSVVIINRSESKEQVPWQEAEKQLDNDVTTVIASVPDLALSGIDRGIPMVAVNPNAMVSIQMSKLAEELIHKTVPQ